MQQHPLVSIVTPSFNQGAFLEETILSVLGQDYPNIEYIIMDGGSTDGSVDTIRKYAGRLAYWASERDEGQTDALMKGFAKATGKYLGWLCSDDVLEPSMVSISVDCHERFPEVGCTFGDRVRIDGKGNIYSLQRCPRFRPWFLRAGLGLPQETSLMKRDAFEKAGGLDSSLQMAMDYDLWCRISRAAAIRHIPAVLGRFRCHGLNKSSAFSKGAAANSDAGAGYFDEYTAVFQRHFGRPFSSRIKSAAKMLWIALAFVDRRSAEYRREAERAARKRAE
ncbi:glycosyltransferase family 2 protein [Verrucomicrobiota bacterium]